MSRFDLEKRKSAADKRAAAAKVAVEPLAPDADLPTTVEKVNEILAQLQAAGSVG